MQFTFEDAYKNVETGLLEAPDNIRAVYMDRAMRYVIEALLLDTETPEGVFMDLLGWGLSDKEIYKHYFFSIPDNIPRLYLFNFIESCPRVTDGDAVRYNLFLGVYDYGWAYIDSSYNKGNRISVQSRAMYSLKKMFGQIDGMVMDCVRNPNANNMQGILKILKMSVDMENNSMASGAPEQLRISFVDKIKEEGDRRTVSTGDIMGMEFDDLNRVKPVEPGSEEQLTLEAMYEDLPKEGQDPKVEPEDDGTDEDTKPDK
jgi:hypothetical protein